MVHQSREAGSKEARAAREQRADVEYLARQFNKSWLQHRTTGELIVWLENKRKSTMDKFSREPDVDNAKIAATENRVYTDMLSVVQTLSFTTTNPETHN